MLLTFCTPVGRRLIPDAPAFDYLFVARYHCLGSLLVFQSFFQDAVSGSRCPSFVLVQQPALVRRFVTSFGVFTCFHPLFDIGHPRVATYVASSLAGGFSVSSRVSSSPQLIENNLFAPQGICSLA